MRGVAYILTAVLTLGLLHNKAAFLFDYWFCRTSYRYVSGGCTVTLVKREAAEALMSELRASYLKQTGNSCDCFVTTPCNGAGVIVPLR